MAGNPYSLFGQNNPFALTPSTAQPGLTHPKPTHHGFLGSLVRVVPNLIGHLAMDVKNAAFGLPVGLWDLGHHPIRGFEEMGKQTWHTWSPVFRAYAHGYKVPYDLITGHPDEALKDIKKSGSEFKKFGTAFYAHPLAPLLDIATVLTGGIGGAAKVTNLLTRAEFKAARVAAGEKAAQIGHVPKWGGPLDATQWKPTSLHASLSKADFRAAVEAGGGRDLIAMHASLSRRAQWGRARAVPVYGKGADGSALMEVRGFHKNPSVRWQQEFKIRTGERLARRIPSWFGETGGIRDFSPAGQFDRLAAKRFATHGAAEQVVKGGQRKIIGLMEADKLAGDSKFYDATAEKLGQRKVREETDLAVQLQVQQFLHAGVMRKKDPWVVAQMMQDHARPQLENRSSIVNDISQLVHKRDKNGKVLKVKPPGGFGLLLKDRLVPETLFEKGTLDELHSFVGIDGKRSKFAAMNITTRAVHPDKLFKDAKGRHRVVRVADMEAYADEAYKAGKMVDLLVGKPTRIWKKLVLGTSPRYFVNNVVGNLFMFIMMSNAHGPRALAEGYKNLYGDRLAARHLSAADKAFQKHLGQGYDAMEYHYGQAMKMGQAHEFTEDLQGRQVRKSRAGRTWQRAQLGVMPLTHQVAERYIRRSSTYGLLRAQPEVRALMKDGYTFDQAVHETAMDVGFHTRISESVNDVLGDYNYLSKTEKQIRNFVPFYTWLRAISRHTGHLVTEHPLRANVLAIEGQLGVEKTKQILGDVPDFLKGAMPLELLGFAHSPHTRAGILTTQGLNPYASVPQAVEAVQALVTGVKRPNEAIASILGPVAAGAMEAITQRSLLTGAPLKGKRGGLIPDVISRQFMQTPLPRLIQRGIEGTPPQGSKPSLYKKDFSQEFRGWLGVPIKQMSPEAARSLFRRQEGIKQPRHRRTSEWTIQGGRGNIFTIKPQNTL